MLTTPINDLVNDLSDLFTWETTLFLLEDSPFASGVFKLFIHFTPKYPLKLPKVNVFNIEVMYLIVSYVFFSYLTLRFSMYKVHFQKEVFHPNVYKEEYALTFCGINGL